MTYLDMHKMVVTVCCVTAVLRQHLMDGRTRYVTTCPWISALRKWRTRWVAPPERVASGHLTPQRLTKWRRRCRNGNAKISQPSAAAWPIQVWNYSWLYVLTSVTRHEWYSNCMACPRYLFFSSDELDKLITDRPESCRQKSVDTGMTRLPSCPPGPTLPITAQLQPQPMVTLSLQCLPMHHHLQLQFQNQSRLAPASPAPAQTPPLHTLPDLMNSSLPQQLAKQPSDFYTIQTDANSEVDALDPSIMDFSWQG